MPGRSGRARRWLRALLGAVAAVAVAAAMLARARSFSFEYEARPARGVGAASLDADVAALVDAAARTARFEGCVVVVRASDAPIFRCADQHGGALDAHTRFSVGSVSKQFVGFVVVEAVRAGRLDLDARVGDLEPALRAAPVARARIRDLLHMTSGLPFTIGLGENLATQLSRRQRTRDEFLHEIARESLAFEPGSAFQYSNPGFGLLAILLERDAPAPGASWRDPLRALFRRIGMNDAGFFTGDEPSPPVPRGSIPLRCGVVVGPPCLRAMPRWNYSMLPAGGMYASADDFAHWFAELFRVRREDRLLFDAFVAEGPFERYAAGIGLAERTLASGEKLTCLTYSGETRGTSRSRTSRRRARPPSRSCRAATMPSWTPT